MAVLNIILLNEMYCSSRMQYTTIMTETDDGIRLITPEEANILKETIKNNINREEWTLRWLFAFFVFGETLCGRKRYRLGIL